jgi:hypothetical protein
MSRKSLINKATDKLSLKKASEDMQTSENLTDSLNSIREDCLDRPTALIDRLI